MRVFHRDYKNPRVYSFNVAYEQELAPDWAGYVDFTWAEGRNLTRFLNYNRSEPVLLRSTDRAPATPTSTAATPWGPQLGEVMVANSLGESRYRGLTLGMRKRFAKGYQLEGNYVLAKDEDNDSNERDPFTDRSFNFFDLDLDWGPSDRDIRHKVNVFGYFAVPGGFQLNARIQGADRAADHAEPAQSRTAPIAGATASARTTSSSPSTGGCPRPFRFGARYELVPMVEMFNTFNNANNINPLSTPALFNFDGFLRTGVGDPRQVQLAVKLLF